MMRIAPSVLAKRIIDSFNVESCETVDSCIERGIRDLEPSLHEGRVFEIADEIKERVKNHIDQYIKECDDKYLPPRARWSDSDPDRLVGCSFVFKDDAPEAATVKRRLKLMPAIWDVIQRLTPNEFEKLCCRLLSEKGFRNLEITRQTRDGGIDFHGETQFGTPPLLITITVIGQAKRYRGSNSITEPQLRDLWGAAHNSTLSGKQILAVFLTTSQFTPDAVKFAKRNGIRTIEGQQIAYFIAESGIGIVEDESSNLSFSKEELLTWTLEYTDNYFE